MFCAAALFSFELGVPDHFRILLQFALEISGKFIRGSLGGRGGFTGDAAAQWRAILANIKSDLEELGSALEHLIRLTFFIKGPFPDGGVLSSPNFRLDVLDEFFVEHCPKHCSYNNPPPSEVIGVAALAQADIVVEIVAVAALPD